MYESELAEADKLIGKQQIQQDLRDEYQQRRDSWNGGYDGWFAGPLNNAQLATVASYNDLVPAFARLLENSEGNLDLFYAVVSEMTRLRPQQREEMLSTLMPAEISEPMPAPELIQPPQIIVSD